ncbi:hypothetical protein BGW80DRAFT_1185385 [Lactifluus volemus]|nr:hypothetical protein BGW80DRAFT_1193232 [Lactifluus volemus]KAH9954824.1 hypothetical protein BGW80DRAFT_1189758 [Lactifluus volemus]KAH9957996.1 hypothetical protein BGW80DRAFT_1185385 [Lactifluus volemus]
MVIAHEDQDNSHPYWYARVIGIFNADICYRDPESGNVDTQHMDFLWVRWFGRDPTYRSGIDARRLPRIGFVPNDDDFAFGFLSPEVVLRAVHLIPGFAHEKTQDLLPNESIARQPSENNLDWRYYYVNIFVDRDMFMRYSGEGVGHKSTRRALRDARFGNPYEIDEAEWIDEDDTLMVADSEEDSHASDTESESSASEHVDLDENLMLY